MWIYVQDPWLKWVLSEGKGKDRTPGCRKAEECTTDAAGQSPLGSDTISNNV
jgi:hypothetical protein